MSWFLLILSCIFFLLAGWFGEPPIMNSMAISCVIVGTILSMASLLVALEKSTNK